MNISVLGCGRWGTFIAWYVCGLNHKVTLWGRENSNALAELKETRKNQFLTLQDEMNLTSSLDETISFGEYIVISISAQQLRALAKQINENNVEGKTFILCMKGIESSTGKRLTQVFREEVGYKCNLAIWVGPGHVQDFVEGIPNCMVIGSDNIEVTKKIADELSSDLIRFYYGQDLIGNEIGAAAKNVIGIAAGMLDGVGFGSLKGALMARGAREVSKLVRAMGGNELTAYGLSHLGDYEATLFSSHSNNRQFGEDYVKKNNFSKLAEGVATAQALELLSKTYNVDLPICNAINSIIGEQKEPKEILGKLFGRTRKFEF